MARCSTRGPCAAVSRGRQAAQRESTWMSAPFRQGRMPCRKAGPGSRTCRAGSPASAKRGGLLFWLLFSWPRKRKVTRAPQAIESSCSESLGASETRTSKSIATEVAPTGGLLPALAHHSIDSAISGAPELLAIQPAPFVASMRGKELFDHAGSPVKRYENIASTPRRKRAETSSYRAFASVSMLRRSGLSMNQAIDSWIASSKRCRGR